MEDEASGKIKTALKGVSAETDINCEHFIDAIYENRNILREQTRLRRHRTQYSMELQRNLKRSVNSVYYKMKVSSDFISCTPHTDSNGEFL